MTSISSYTEVYASPNGDISNISLTSMVNGSPTSMAIDESFSHQYETIVDTDSLLASGGLTSASLNQLIYNVTPSDSPLYFLPDYAHRWNYPREGDIEHYVDLDEAYSKVFFEAYPRRNLINGDGSMSVQLNQWDVNDATIIPIPINDISFNVDVVANGDLTDRPQPPIPEKHAMFSTSRPLEDTRFTGLKTVLVSEDFRGEYNPAQPLKDIRVDAEIQSSQLLPSDGVYYAVAENGISHKYQLQSYEDYNGIMLCGDTEDVNGNNVLGQAEITLEEPMAYSELHFLVTGTGLDVDLDIEFADGTKLYGLSYRFNGLIAPPFELNGTANTSYFKRAAANLLVAREQFLYDSRMRNTLLEVTSSVDYPQLVCSPDYLVNPDFDGVFYHLLKPSELDINQLAYNSTLEYVDYSTKKC